MPTYWQKCVLGSPKGSYGRFYSGSTAGAVLEKTVCRGLVFAGGPWKADEVTCFGVLEEQLYLQPH